MPAGAIVRSNLGQTQYTHPKVTRRIVVRRRSYLPIAAALLAVSASPTFAQDASPAAPAEGSAWVRVLHASPDAPAVDIWLDGAAVGAPLAGLEFGALSPYVEVPAGPHAIKVCASADATVCPIDVPEVTVEAGGRYTIAATNELASIEPQVIADSGIGDPAKAWVRFVHFSADAPSVDVLTQDGSATVAGGLTYPNATEYLALDPGSYDLKVCATEDTTVCPIDPPAVDVAAGQVYSVFALGSLAGGTITAVVAVDTADAPVPSAAASMAP
jgi:hypothetical protein